MANPIRDLANVTPGTVMASAPVVADANKFVEDERTMAQVHVVKARYTVAQINAGVTLLPAVNGVKYRMVACSLIAEGGDAATATGVLVRGTQAGSVVKLMDAKVAGLTEDTLLRDGTATNGVILAAGASYDACDHNTAITVIKDGSDLATATHVHVHFTYSVERA